MAEIKLSFDLTFSRRFITSSATLAIMLCAVPELDSESVTLSTYYPAPSGVYTNMITTSDTYLARNGGNVGIGTVSPGAKLDVSGVGRFQGVTTLDDSSQRLFLGRFDATNPYSYIAPASGSSGFKFNDAAISAELVTIQNSGNVGIGTT
ncbi:MAG: hypothetical protein Q7J64_03790, partial [Elusimicrobiota bacterium]|nr:hypothetical protein [Elusimicrobiota bacterium]